MIGTIALIGDPVAHSVSPAMQRAGFAEAGLDLDYVAVRVPLEELPVAFRGLAERFAGLNVTRPLKEAVIELLAEVRAEARAAGSVNTVVFAAGRSIGESTDGRGFLAALRRVDPRPRGRATILGTGGASRAVAAGLLADGSAVTVVGRNEAAGTRLAADLPGVRFVALDPRMLEDLLGACDLLVNATPVGGPDDPAASPVPPEIELDPATTVFDLVYRPRRTALLARAESAGCRTVEGIEMLIEQGAASFELWTRAAAPVEVMRAAAYGALEAEPCSVS